MNAAAVMRVLSLIPERSPRALTGTLFTDDEASRAVHADRVQYVARFLGWLSPLNPITKDDQRFLGLLATHARPDHAAEDEAGDEGEEFEGAEALDDAAEDAVYDEAPASRPALTLANPSVPISSGGGS
jgi:hypothetical protein